VVQEACLFFPVVEHPTSCFPHALVPAVLSAGSRKEAVFPAHHRLSPADTGRADQFGRAFGRGPDRFGFAFGRGERELGFAVDSRLAVPELRDGESTGESNRSKEGENKKSPCDAPRVAGMEKHIFYSGKTNGRFSRVLRFIFIESFSSPCVGISDDLKALLGFGVLGFCSVSTLLFHRARRGLSLFSTALFLRVLLSLRLS